MTAVAQIRPSPTERFRYRAVNSSGAVVAGVFEAVSRQSVLMEMERLSLMPIEIGEERPSRRSFSRLFSREPRPEEITEATRDLATLVTGGVNLDRALLAIAETGELPSLAVMMRSVNSGVTAGKSLAEALSAHPRSFPPQYVKMVEVAEAKGKLGETLALIARERTRSEGLKQRIVSVLAYPAFLFVAALAVLGFVLSSVVPEFERALSGFEGGEHGQANAIFALSRAFRDNATALAAIAILSLTGLLAGIRSPAARAAFFRALAKAPGARKAVSYEQTAVICSTLSALLASGVDISSALRLVRDLMRDRRAADRLDRAVGGVRQGGRLSDVMRDEGVLPAYATHMLRVGEKSGETSASLARISRTYEERLDRSLGRIAAIVGPAVLVAVSVMIAWIIISVMTALLSMNDLLLSGSAIDAAATFA